MNKRISSRVLGGLVAFCAVVGVFFPVGAVLAETRFYESSRPRGATMEAFVDELTRSGIRFSIRKVFNETKDGRVGFVFLLAPKRSYCEATFHEQVKGGGTLVRIMTQSTEDTNRFDALLTGRLKLKAVGDDPARFGDTRGFTRRR